MKKKKLRIMVNSNAPYSPSGYSNQCRQFVPLLQKEGYETGFIAFYGLEGGIIDLEGVKYYPKISDPYGGDAMINHSKHFKPDIMFTLQDIWTIDPGVFKALADMKVRWIPIIPLDHEPLPPSIKERLRLAYRITTISEWGMEEMQRQGFHATYLPHSVDTSVFYKRDKAEIRKKLNIPQDGFVFGMVAANKDNPPRKGFQEAMDAFKMFNDKHPNSYMYFHVMTKVNTGFPIEEYAKVLGIQDKVYVTDFYNQMFTMGWDDMANLYSAFDVTLLPSKNEGFGIPIIESQACEVPVIATNFTAMRSLIQDGKTGYRIKVARKTFDPLLSYSAVADTQDLYEKMEQIFKDDREKMGKAAREWMVKDFDTQAVWSKHWKGFLEKLESEVYPIDKK